MKAKKGRPQGKTTVNTSVSLPVNVFEMTKDDATRRGITVSAIMLIALEAELTRSFQDRLKSSSKQIDPSNFLVEEPTEPPGNPLIHELPATEKARTKKGASAS